MRLQLGACIAALAAAQLVAPLAASAQTVPDACVVPTSGNLYRVGIANTPAECRPGHAPMSLGVQFPFSRTIESTGVMLQLVNTGAGPAANFANFGGGNALFLTNNSTGPATIHARNQGNAATGYFQSLAGGAAIMGIADVGGGYALIARANREGGPAAHIENTGPGGAALYARNASPGPTLNVNNVGTGAGLQITAASEHSAAVVNNSGTMPGSNALALYSVGGNQTLWVHNTGTANGTAAGFLSSSSNPTANFRNQGTGGAFNAMSNGANSTIWARNESTGPGNTLYAESAGEWTTAHFRNTGVGGALYMESAGSHPAVNIQATGTGNGLNVRSSAFGGTFETTSTGQAIALLAQSAAVWPAAQFHNTNGPALRTFGMVDINANTTDDALRVNQGGSGVGLRINGVPGATALLVQGATTVNGQLQINGSYSATGTKNAAVETSRGTRLMYSEEATEVWFTDYGFGRLDGTEVLVSFDPLYAETANLGEAYHVFLQAYGAAELYVTERTAHGFRVKLAAGDPGTEFSYRVVAKRMNYERDRLEAAPAAARTGGR
jgi:hypothetical protein